MLLWNGGDISPLLGTGDSGEHAAQALLRDRTESDLARYLVDRNLVTVGQMLAARIQMRQDRVSLADIAMNEGWIGADDLLTARAASLSLERVDLAATPPDPVLMHMLDPATCLRLEMLPWQLTADGTLLMATARPEGFAERSATLPAPFHRTQAVVVTSAELEAAITLFWRSQMTDAALVRVPAAESCRTWARPGWMRHMILAVLAMSGLALILVFPTASFAVLVAWALATLLVAALHRSAAIAAFVLQRRSKDQGAAQIVPPPSQRPVVSIMVPLFREPEVADILIRRLEKLRYPKALLDVLLILEECDTVTRSALARARLPPWTRVIVVPDGQPRTKPRAMNYALDFCRGEIIGIYDAEDAPDPDQIDQIVARFATTPPDLVCLQGILDYYNPRQNWLARCFTIEYASWFRVMMPGMVRLGFAIPLGGTTLFFRRKVLEDLGGWDAHNVTEDADLGFRLARHGYRAEMIATTTHEEANCHLLAWIRQRSRWLKGYMVTYLVHMRQPRLLLRQLGPWRFIGYQTHFITTLSQFFLAPVLWSFWLILLGLPHPLDGVLSPVLLTTIARLFLLVEVMTITAGLLAVSGPAHRHLLFWVPTLHFYFPLGVLAVYQALYELVTAPFFWDKTTHGHSMTPRHRHRWIRRRAIPDF